MSDGVLNLPWRVLITGSQEWDNEEKLCVALQKLWKPGAFLRSGACPRGADRMAEELWAGWDGIVLRYPADWSQPCTDRCASGHRRESARGSWCPRAGFARSEYMVELGVDVCLACYKVGAKNAGTSHCADYAAKTGIKVIKIRG